MIRPFTILCFCAFAGAGAWLYHVKHSVALQDAELRTIWRQIEQDRDRTSILRAEWALLNEPERLRQVVTRHLSLEPMQPQQFARPEQLDRRLPPALTFAGAPNLFVPANPGATTPGQAAPGVMVAATQDAGPAQVAAVTPDTATQDLALADQLPPAPPPAPPLPSFATPQQAPRAYAQVQAPAAPDVLAAAEAPAPQVLAAVAAVQRASRPQRTTVREVQPAIHYAPAPIATPGNAAPRIRSTEASAPVRTASNAPPPIQSPTSSPVAPNPAPTPVYVSALGGATSLGLARPTMAPPVPFSAAQAATLERQGTLAPPRTR